MSAAVATAAAGEKRHLVHFSSRAIEEWGKIPKKSEYNDSLKISMSRIAARTGKPMGIWYAYDTSWVAHYKNSVNKNPLLSPKNKANWFSHKYVFDVADDKFTTDINPAPTKILELSNANFGDFLAKYEAPGVKSSKKTWREFWDGLKDKFAGIEFKAEIATMKPDSTGKIPIKVDDEGVEKIVDASFLKFLEIESGVIFHPEAILSGVPSDYLVRNSGGRRTTRRKRSLLGSAPQRRSDGGVIGFNKQSLLNTVPRRLSTTRRSRSRV
jgi:hypothetical protein